MNDLKYKIEVMTAADNGAEIEFMDKTGKTWIYFKYFRGADAWNWNLYNYRIKAAPTPPKKVLMDLGKLPAIFWLRGKHWEKESLPYSNTHWNLGIGIDVVRKVVFYHATSEQSNNIISNLGNSKWEWSPDRKIVYPFMVDEGSEWA